MGTTEENATSGRDARRPTPAAGKRRRHQPLRRSPCPYCGQELVAGEHRSGGLTLLTSVVPMMRETAADLGLTIQPGQHTVLVEQSAFGFTVCIEQPAWTFE